MSYGWLKPYDPEQEMRDRAALALKNLSLAVKQIEEPDNLDEIIQEHRRKHGQSKR